MSKKAGPSEHKTLPFIQLKTDEAQGIVEHLIAIHGVLDEGKDISHPGSFAKTITERGHKVKVLDKHQTDSVMRVVGKAVRLEEVGKDALPTTLLERYPEATGGVKATTQFLMETPEGKGVFERIRAGAVDEFSYGYDALDVDYSTVSAKDGEEVEARNLRTVKLYEYSPVIWGMNPATQTLSAKETTMDDDKAAGLPLADRERAWDADGAKARVRNWAGAEDGPNSKYGRAFFWVGEPKDNFGSYKLPFADVVDGTLTAIPRGIFAVAGVLSGARNGADISNVDAVKSKVAGYYAKMRTKFDDDSIVPPWEKDTELEAEAKVEVTENYIRVPADSGDHSGHRIRTITISADQGIKALYCGECKKVITYLFDKDKWETAAAKKWVSDHKKSVDDALAFKWLEITDEGDELALDVEALEKELDILGLEIEELEIA